MIVCVGYVSKKFDVFKHLNSAHVNALKKIFAWEKKDAQEN
jgi:hypothetical protein